MKITAATPVGSQLAVKVSRPSKPISRVLYSDNSERWPSI